MNDSKNSLISIENAAKLRQLEPSTLRALIKRDRFNDPIGDDREVYDDSRLRRLHRAALSDAALTILSQGEPRA